MARGHRRNGRSAGHQPDRHAFLRRRHLQRPLLRQGRDDEPRFTSSASGVSSTSSNDITVSPADRQPAHHQHPAVANGDRRPAVRNPARDLRRRSVQQPRSGDNTTVVTAMLNSGAGPLRVPPPPPSRAASPGSPTSPTTSPRPITLEFTSGTLDLGAIQHHHRQPRDRPAKLVIHTQPSTTATAGQAFAVQPVIYLEDAKRQHRDERQQHGRDRLAGQRQRPASGDQHR